MDYGRKAQELRHPDNSSAILSGDIESDLIGMKQILYECSRKMRARVIEVMYTALHPYGPKVAKVDAKTQDVRDALHDYRILQSMATAGSESAQNPKDKQYVYLPNRKERVFTFSTWARMDKGVSTELRIVWDCFTSSHNTAELVEKLKGRKDVGEINARLEIVRKQGMENIHLRYQEERQTNNHSKTITRVWEWMGREGADVKQLVSHKGWAYLGLVLIVNEENLRRLKDDQEDPHAKERANHDTAAECKLLFYFQTKITSPMKVQKLELRGPAYKYKVQVEDMMGELTTQQSTDNMGGPQSRTMTVGSKGMSMGSMGGTQSMGGTGSMGGMGSTGSGMIGASASKSLGSGMVGATGSGTIKSGAVGTGSMGSGMVGGTGGSGAIGEKGPVKVAESMGKEEIWRSFAKEPLETFMPLFFPSEIMEQSLFALLSINPRTVGTPERRDVVGRAIMMPDVFLQHQLVHMLVPFCGKQVSAAPIAKWSSHTLYLLLASFLRTVPLEAAEMAEVENRLRQFDTILEQFRICCQLGNPENSQGGVRVLMDLVWKLFTRRQTVVSPEVYFTMAIDGVTANNANAIQTADNFYDVRFLHKVIELLTDLCISLDGRAVTAFQTFIANELFITNEASAVWRRPEPECSDNVWSKKKMTLQDHEAENNRPGQKGKGLERLRGEKAAFTLLKLGTAIHFNLADALAEASNEDVVIPRVLWTQDRAQPPRFENGNYTDDVVTGQGVINQARMLYFALVNLIAHLAADRHTLNSKRTKDNIPHHVVRNQLIQQEVLGCAGLMFVPQNLRAAKMAAAKNMEARDLGDVSDLTALSAHVALLLHGFLGQRPFADEQKRSTIALKLYMDGTRADDDDTVFEEHGSVLALQPEDLERLCQMCSWQFASIAELCREMSQWARANLGREDMPL